MKQSLFILFLMFTILFAACGSDEDETATNDTASADTISSADTSNPAPQPNNTNPTDVNETDTVSTLQIFEACEGTFTLTEPNPNYAWTANAVELVSQDMGGGVFVILDKNAPEYLPVGYPIATSGGFIVGDDGVLLIETMINRQLFCQVIDLVKEETDLPILYAVNTSHHGDHSYGNTFLTEDVQVVQHERTAEFIANYFEEDVEWMSMNFGTDQGLDEVTAVPADVLVTDDGWSVDLGGQAVQVRYYGFGQTNGDLFVWSESAKVLWTGNALIAEAPAIPWLLDGHAEQVHATLSAIKAELTVDTVIVPGHGRPVGVDALDFSINYLGTLSSEVQASIDAGMTLDETIGAVTMESFQGYALWDWVHYGVNVTNTFKEMTE